MNNRKIKRAPNGAGSIRKRKDGSWEARFTASDGRQHSLYAKTEKEAKEKLKKANAEMTLGVWFKGSSMTVENWLQLWLDEYTNHIKPITKENYKRYVDSYINPVIGGIQLDKLKTIHVQRVVNAMGEKNLSSGTMKSCMIALSSALSSAKKFDMINDNPCKNVTITKSVKRDLIIIDRQDIALFVKLAEEDDQFGVAMLFILQTGLRTGEVRGLRWADVDFDNKAIYIRQQINFSPDGNIMRQAPKSNKYRKISMMDETVALLRQHKRRQAETRIMAGGWTDTEITKDLVFRMKNGDMYSKDGLYYAVKHIGKLMGIDGLHTHSLRDSYAVAALRSGVEVKTVQNNLGHASAAMTLDTYATYTDDMGRIAAEKLSAYWAENVPR